VGGMITLPTTVYKIVLGAVLMLAALRLAWKFSPDTEIKQPPIWICLMIGAVIGLLSGLVGVGGGIFLTPVLLLMNWSETKTAAGVSALFILVNSIAGLAGHFAANRSVPSLAIVLAAAAVIGGILGSYLGSRRFPVRTISLLLATVLVIAGAKLIFTR